MKEVCCKGTDDGRKCRAMKEYLLKARVGSAKERVE